MLPLFNIKTDGEELNLDKYHNYIIFNTMLREITKPLRTIQDSAYVLKHLFDDSYERQAEVLFYIQDLIVNSDLDKKRHGEMVFSHFHKFKVLDEDFLVDWKNGSKSIYENMDLGKFVNYDEEVD